MTRDSLTSTAVKTSQASVTEIAPSIAAVAACLEDGVCWQLRSKEHTSKPKHFLVHADAVKAMDETFNFVEKRTCMDSDCVATRAAAIDAFHELQSKVEQDQAATARAWHLVATSNGETTKADTKSAFIVSIAAATLLSWTAGSSTLHVNQPLRWLATTFLLASVLAVVWAVRPRMPRPSTGAGNAAGMNFGAVRRLSADELAAALRGIDELAAATCEAVELARIVHTKYAVLGWAVAAGACGLILSVAAVAVG
ncbi:Pycsar system effector family protein [Kribbella sp. NPDC059898]|uniref:Pycsar system effector family protein n=1 Tax=Kribbella sp. NPDC059898 TaxID=3346995 RepID=UPI0036602A87